jgi:metal-responsive CopG/Arc/MetJ family transcriptional regulator
MIAIMAKKPVVREYHLSARVSKALVDELDKIAAADGRTRSNLVERIVTEYVAARKQQQQPPKHYPRQ